MTGRKEACVLCKIRIQDRIAGERPGREVSPHTLYEQHHKRTNSPVGYIDIGIEATPGIQLNNSNTNFKLGGREKAWSAEGSVLTFCGGMRQEKLERE